MPDTVFLVSCEHAVNHVPEQWRHLFASHQEVLGTHRAYDPGALELARHLAKALAAPCFEAEATRLLIDLNRSPHNRFLWSRFSRGITKAEKNSLIDNYYLPFRSTVEQWIEKQRTDGRTVVHLSVHSFAPVLNSRVRHADIGILFDPKRVGEKKFARTLKNRLFEQAQGLRVRLNYPYRGVSDCHQKTYRLQYGSTGYLALELEVSQSLVLGNASRWRKVRNLLSNSIRQ